MRQSRVWMKMKQYLRCNKYVIRIINMFKKPCRNEKNDSFCIVPNDSVKIGVDCLNYNIDKFRATMDEINGASTDDSFN